VYKNKTAFSAPYGHYEFNRISFELKKRISNTLAIDEPSADQNIRSQMLVCFDDIVIYEPNLREHNNRLIEVLKRLRKLII